jgi:hypothetical protein
MKSRWLGLWLFPLLLGTSLAATPQTGGFFPFPYTTDDLPNGLRLVTVPTDYPNLVALYILFVSGS